MVAVGALSVTSFPEGFCCPCSRAALIWGSCHPPQTTGKRGVWHGWEKPHRGPFPPLFSSWFEAQALCIIPVWATLQLCLAMCFSDLGPDLTSRLSLAPLCQEDVPGDLGSRPTPPTVTSLPCALCPRTTGLSPCGGGSCLPPCSLWIRFLRRASRSCCSLTVTAEPYCIFIIGDKMTEICAPSPVSAGLYRVSFYMVLQLLLADSWGKYAL